MDSLVTLVDLIGRRYGLGHHACRCALCNRRRALAAIDNLNAKFGGKRREGAK